MQHEHRIDVTAPALAQAVCFASSTHLVGSDDHGVVPYYLGQVVQEAAVKIKDVDYVHNQARRCPQRAEQLLKSGWRQQLMRAAPVTTIGEPRARKTPKVRSTVGDTWHRS